jgi:hypothetical protein
MIVAASAPLRYHQPSIIRAADLRRCVPASRKPTDRSRQEPTRPRLHTLFDTPDDPYGGHDRTDVNGQLIQRDFPLLPLRQRDQSVNHRHPGSPPERMDCCHNDLSVTTGMYASHPVSVTPLISRWSNGLPSRPGRPFVAERGRNLGVGDAGEIALASTPGPRIQPPAVECGARRPWLSLVLALPTRAFVHSSAEPVHTPSGRS